MERKDVYERINYLYQAAHVVLERKSSEDQDAKQLSRHFGAVLKTIAKRGVLKLDPSLKRSLCKKCNAVLIPGTTCSIRLKSKRELHYVITCLHCKTLKRLPCRENHQLWSENPLAQAEILHKIQVVNRFPSEKNAVKIEKSFLEDKSRCQIPVKDQTISVKTEKPVQVQIGSEIKPDL